MKRFVLILMSLTLIIMSFTGCTIRIGDKGIKVGKTIEIGDTIVDNIQEPIGDTKELQLKLSAAIGDVNIIGGSNKLIEGEIKYNVKAWKPVIIIDEDNYKKKIEIKPPKTDDIHFGNDNVYTWNIQLNEQVPLDIIANIGIGKSNLNFSELNVQNIKVDTGVGDSNIILNGVYNSPIDIEIKGGLGNTDINLKGDFNENVTADIQGGLGDIDILLPKDIGVKVEVELGLGDIKVNGLKKVSEDNEKIYKNDLYDKSNVKIILKIEAGMGDIKLR
ncbi:toast rack family protein [Abyssisolibacter fermentans]|uniref:toast rack family protein n=1 Tax=Abyssisolibacter fermentans TaxID=1766203 RepID=UPI000835F5FA|nr:toast rack family protein [Abyssisolibacter fermentans]